MLGGIVVRSTLCKQGHAKIDQANVESVVNKDISLISSKCRSVSKVSETAHPVKISMYNPFSMKINKTLCNLDSLEDVRR